METLKQEAKRLEQEIRNNKISTLRMRRMVYLSEQEIKKSNQQNQEILRELETQSAELLSLLNERKKQ